MDQYIGTWIASDLSFEIVDDATSDPVVTVIVSTPVGALHFMAEPEVQGTTLVLHSTHVQGASANAVGVANLHALAQLVMERMNFDGLRVEGAVRTTGANPGHQPHVIRFTRRIRVAPDAGTGNP